MKTFIRQLFVALLGGAVAAAIMLVAYHIGIGRGPSIALAQTAVSVSNVNSPDADAAKTINYQGQVFNPNNSAPLANSTLGFNFRITTDAASTNSIYQENKNITTNAAGFFSTRIGDTAAFGGTDNTYKIFNGQELYLVVFINNEQLSPPQPITFVPYALWSLQASHLDNHGSDDFPKIVAHGAVDRDGNKTSGAGFSVSRQNVGGTNTYVVSIDNNVSFDINNYTAIITPACLGNPAIGDVGASQRPNTNINDMIVDIFDANGNHTKCAFQFMVLQR